jgi:hypothetical protein
MNKSKRYNKSKRVKRFRKTKKGGSWLNGLFGIFKSRNAQKMEPNPIQGTPSNASKVPPSTVSQPVVQTNALKSNALKMPNSSTVSPPLNKPVVSNMLPKK